MLNVIAPRITIFDRIGNESESTCHLPVDHVVLRATRRLIALPGEHTEVVAVKSGVRVGLYAITFCSCERRQRP